MLRDCTYEEADIDTHIIIMDVLTHFVFINSAGEKHPIAEGVTKFVSTGNPGEMKITRYKRGEDGRLVHEGDRTLTEELLAEDIYVKWSNEAPQDMVDSEEGKKHPPTKMFFAVDDSNNPVPGSCWRHKNGNIYVKWSNEAPQDMVDSEEGKKHPPTKMFFAVDDSNNPVPGSCWRHKNGNIYRVLFLTNLPNEERYPLTVVYENVLNGSAWSRRADDWHRSFTPC